MTNRTDILLDENYDLIDEGEEWAEGPSDEQHVELLLILDKGEIREFPWAGFGIQRHLKKRTNAQQFLREMEIELDNDGYGNAKIITGATIGDFKIEI